MKTIGMIGGLSWESTAQYYQTINQEIKVKLGGLHSAKINLQSMDFSEIEKLLTKGDWSLIAHKLIAVAQLLESSGADFLMICNNTLHNVADKVEQEINIPFLHIADATGRKLLEDNVRCIGLLGTKQTMELNFYKNRLEEKFGIKVLTPDLNSRGIIQNIIFNELCIGKFQDASRNQLLSIIKTLEKNGANAIVLGCTELPLLVQKHHTPLPIYDTGELHSREAVNLALTNFNLSTETKDNA